MTIGTGTFYPGARFAFPRSYIYQLDIAGYGDLVTQVGNIFTIHDTVGGTATVAIIKIDNRFVPWSSNGWTLDFIVTDFYALINGNPPEVPLNFALGYAKSSLNQRPCLRFEWFTGAPLYQTFPLAGQPLNYWLPLPLP